MDNKNTKRKAYISPKLMEHGSIKELTLMLGKNGISDGGTATNGKNYTKL